MTTPGCLAVSRRWKGAWPAVLLIAGIAAPAVTPAAAQARDLDDFELEPASTAKMVTPGEYLATQTPPAFREGHTLPRLTRFGWTLPFDARVALARDWGYALELGGYTGMDVVERMDKAGTIEAGLVELANREPDVYGLQVILSRELPIGEEAPSAVAEPPSLAPTSPVSASDDATDDDLTDEERAAERKAMIDRPGVNPPGDPWTRDADGETDFDGRRFWSPEAPWNVMQAAAAARAKPLAEVARRAPVAIVLNGGEYALTVLGFGGEAWRQDPRIQQARGETPWFDYISARKAHMELAIAAAVKEAAPDRQAYIFYYDGGGGHRNRFGGWKQWAYGYEWMRGVGDLPASSIYYRHFNSGWTGGMNMLTMALNARGVELEHGDRFTYNWVCAGWPRGSDQEKAEGKGLGDLERYAGYLKMIYLSGTLGANAGYYAYPQGGFGVRFPEDEPPHWIRQMMVLGRVHALFSHLEDDVRGSDLLPGPDRHVWSRSRPAYEFPTGDADARVLARRVHDQPRWLVGAWAAGGPARDVTVEIPDLGSLTVTAQPDGAVYVVERDGDEVHVTVASAM